MTDEPEFIRRWSRRKQAARNRDGTGVPPDPEASRAQDAGAEPERPGEGEHPAGQPESEAGEAEALDLPDVESLTAESDFTPFLKPGVPKELKNRALRKLWRVNPVFGQLDGLNDYDGDFTDAASVVKDLKTLYKVGRGFLPDPKQDAADAASGDAPIEDPQGAVEGDRQEDGPETGERNAAAADDDENGNNVS